ncbi:MAG: PH domain-containing protein [Prevotella sp.]
MPAVTIFIVYQALMKAFCRSFHHRITLGAGCGIILCLVAAFWLFWVKMVVLGALMALVVILMCERVFHTEYILYDDRLVIRRGRLSRDKTIALCDITHCRMVSVNFGLSHYLLIQYGDDRMVCVEPQNEATFIGCLKKLKAES